MARTECTAQLTLRISAFRAGWNAVARERGQVEKFSAVEVVTAVFLCLSVVGGAAYGLLVVGTVWATVGGAVLIGVFALLLVSLIAIATEAVSRLIDRLGRR